MGRSVGRRKLTLKIGEVAVSTISIPEFLQDGHLRINICT